MTDLTRYRIDAPFSSVYVKDWNASPFNMVELERRGVLVPDSTLQDIADAWNVMNSPSHSVADSDNAWESLRKLLDAVADMRENQNE